MSPPNVAASPVGLPEGDIARLRKLAKTRANLYALHVVWSFFTAAMIFLAPVDAIEPIFDLRWLPEFISFIIPGLPSNLVDVALRRPMVVGALILTYILIRRASSLVRNARWEYAFQAWQRTPTAGINMLPPPIPEPSAFVKLIETISPPQKLTGNAAIVFALLIVLDMPDCFYPSPSVADQACANSDPGKTTYACADATYPCRLETGESVTVTIRSDRVPNETGIILDTHVLYEAQFVEKAEWRDDTREVAPEGFEFEENWVGLPRFWWAKWLRPYPEGLWFQVVGRTKEERDVFPVLGKNNPREPYKFTTDEGGELVLLVNDIRYKNNHGIMKIEIHRPQRQVSSVHTN